MKAEAEAEIAREEVVIPAEQTRALEEKSDEQILAELELPDPACMKQGDDFSVFMRRAVPERIRKQALRQLWRSNPVLANLDGLVDYADDYTDAATVVENLSTTYVVGRGMLAHILEVERQQKASETETAPETVESDLVDPQQAENVAEKSCDPMPACDEEIDEEASDPEDIHADSEMRPARRMRFTFSAQPVYSDKLMGGA